MTSSYINEPSRRTPIVWEGDVCVLGGSCTGVFAAIAAARLGSSACVVENLGGFGGTATFSLDCVWHTMLDGEFNFPIASGLPMELLKRLDKRNAVEDRGPASHLQYIFHPYEMVIELDEMIQEAGVKPFLHTRFVTPILGDDGRIEAVIVEDQSGRRAIKARFFVDATGDALLVDRAGMETYRRPHLQPPTAVALIKGMTQLREHEPDFKYNWFFDRRYPEALPNGFCWGEQVRGLGDIEMIAGTRVHDVDCSDADELTYAEIEGRRQVRAMTDLLRRVAKDPKDIALVGLGARIGIRQTRQAKCLHELTEAEVLHGVRFEDAIVNGSYRVDVHYHDRGGLVFRNQDGTEEIFVPGEEPVIGRWRPETKENPTFWQIPYRALVPKDSRNVLVAGRCLDADEGAFGAVRVMVNTTQMGQAAGTAAWLALESQRDAAEVDTKALRTTLADQGAVIL
jgi:glycine/D-amino acid oxidase-like deaminating enzyme